MQKHPSEWTDEETEAWIRSNVEPQVGETYRTKASVWRLVAMGLEDDFWSQQMAWRISRKLDQKAKEAGEWD
jgi:hypothetical protein